MINDPMQLSQIKILHFKKKYQSGLLNVYIDKDTIFWKTTEEKAPNYSISSRFGVTAQGDLGTKALFTVLAVNS